MCYPSNVGLRKTGNRGLLDFGEAIRGKSELQRAECWLTASEGDLKESATETYRPIAKSVRAVSFAGRGHDRIG